MGTFYCRLQCWTEQDMYFPTGDLTLKQAILRIDSSTNFDNMDLDIISAMNCA